MMIGILCQVLHLAALEGRTDGRSQRTIIGHLAPRHLAIVRGSDEVRPRVGLIPPDPACRWLPRPLRLLHATLAARTYLKMLEPPPAAPLRIPQSNSRGLWCALTLDFSDLPVPTLCLPACLPQARGPLAAHCSGRSLSSKYLQGGPQIVTVCRRRAERWRRTAGRSWLRCAARCTCPRRGRRWTSRPAAPPSGTLHMTIPGKASPQLALWLLP